MIEIKAVVRPARLDLLRTALKAIPNFPGMTVVRAEGCSGNDSTRGASHSIKQDLTDFSQKVMIYIVAHDEQAQEIYDRIAQTTRTERHGDGLIWMTPIQTCLSIASLEPI